jgi:hypothetical protein
MQLSITSPTPSASLRQPFTVRGTCDAIPGSPGPVVPVAGIAITVDYNVSGVQNATRQAQCYSDQTWTAEFNGVTPTANGAIKATCPNTACPSALVLGLTVV